MRIISRKLADGKYYKRKAVVHRVIDKYAAEVEVLDTNSKTQDGGDVLRLDQDDLESVIPKKVDQDKVRLLNGKYRGEKARAVQLDKESYRATLRLTADDRVIADVPFEDFSKIA